MEYVTLGRSGLRVSRLCLGCMSYGTPEWRPWILDEEASGPFFRRAVELGINFFDTADVYSLGVSEEVTGRALAEYAQRDEIVVATKAFFPMAKGPNMRGLSRKHLVQACEASLRRLGVEAIDLYQLHRFDPYTPLEETLAALDQLVRQGKVLYVGASSTWAWRLMKALGLADLYGYPRFVSMQNHYNLLYREEEREMIPLCQSEGLGLIPWSPLARGHLARPSQSADSRRAETDEITEHLYKHEGDAEIVRAVEVVAGELGVSMAEVALAWLLSKPSVVAPIVGVTKPEHLETAVSSLDLVLPHSAIERLEAPYTPREVVGWLDRIPAAIDR